MSKSKKLREIKGKQLESLKLEKLHKVRDVLDQYFLYGLCDDEPEPSYDDYKDAEAIIDDIIDIKIGVTNEAWRILNDPSEDIEYPPKPCGVLLYSDGSIRLNFDEFHEASEFYESLELRDGTKKTICIVE